MLIARNARLTAACAIALTACRAQGHEASPSPREDGVRVSDDIGRTVELPRPATRIAALSPGFVETLFAIGCGDAVILRDDRSDFPSPAVDAIPKTDGVQVSVRNVAGYTPDLVLLYADDGRFADDFARVHVPTAVLNPRTYDEVAGGIEKIGLLCGRKEAAARVSAAMRAAREKVAREIDGARRPSVFIEIDATDPTRPWTAGTGSFVDELLSLAGGRNALTGLPSAYAQVSAEAVIRAAPAVVLLVDDTGKVPAAAEEIRRRPGWAALPAIAAGRVVAGIDGDLLSRPGPRLADGLRALAAALADRRSRDGGTP